MKIPKNTIVSTTWLNEHLQDEDIIVLDASKSIDDQDRRGALQIVGSRKFNIKEEFSDTTSNYPTMLCSPKQFEINCRKLGLNKSSNIIIYDNLGITSSPRAWWMFKTMGHERVAVLDGGLPNWIKEQYPTEQLIVRHHPIGDFSVNFHSDSVKSFEQLQSNILSQELAVVDARSSERFDGRVQEPRQGLRRGHIPDSINIPFNKVLSNNTFKSTIELNNMFKTLKQTKKPCVYSCGSGGSACIILLAAEIAGITNNAIYDGSWTEWAQRTTV